jgi:hypothetical protein
MANRLRRLAALTVRSNFITSGLIERAGLRDTDAAIETPLRNSGTVKFSLVQQD